MVGEFSEAISRCVFLEKAKQEEKFTKFFEDEAEDIFIKLRRGILRGKNFEEYITI